MSRATRVSIQTRSVIFTYGTITLYGSSFQKIWLMTDFLTCRGICNFLRIDPTTPLTQCLQTWHVNGLGSSLFARRYLGNHYYFLFLELLRCISSLRYLYQSYRFRLKYLDITQDAFSHSEIPGSKVVCTSPRLIAANHVLHRLHVPRHPPYALSSFIKESILSMILPLSFPNCQIAKNFCGASRVRTDDLLDANQALSQLSYSPNFRTSAQPWACVDSNHGPHPYQGCALTT